MKQTIKVTRKSFRDNEARITRLDSVRDIFLRRNKVSSRGVDFVSFILDYKHDRYLHVDNSCQALLGLPAKQIMEKGLTEFTKHWHPGDQFIFEKYITQANLKYLQGLKVPESEHHIFSHSFRLRTPSGLYRTLIQRIQYVLDSQFKLPVGAVGILFDATHFASPDRVIHTIEAISGSPELFNLHLVSRTAYLAPAEMNAPFLSRREMEIMTLLADGRSSKEIASFLGISVNTVNNHRKKMLQKYNVDNVASLLRKYQSGTLMNEL